MFGGFSKCLLDACFSLSFLWPGLWENEMWRSEIGFREQHPKLGCGEPMRSTELVFGDRGSNLCDGEFFLVIAVFVFIVVVFSRANAMFELNLEQLLFYSACLTSLATSLARCLFSAVSVQITKIVCNLTAHSQWLP